MSFEVIQNQNVQTVDTSRKKKIITVVNRTLCTRHRLQLLENVNKAQNSEYNFITPKNSYNRYRFGNNYGYGSSNRNGTSTRSTCNTSRTTGLSVWSLLM